MFYIFLDSEKCHDWVIDRSERADKKFLYMSFLEVFGRLEQRRVGDLRSEGQRPWWWAIREQKGRDMSNRSHKRSARHFPGLTWPQKTGPQRSEWRLLIGEPKVRKKRRDLGMEGGEEGPSGVSFSLEFPLLCSFFKIGGNKMRSRAHGGLWLIAQPFATKE